jgi:hypothetical protein
MFIEVSEVYRDGGEFKVRPRTVNVHHIISFYPDQITVGSNPSNTALGTMMSVSGRGSALPLSNEYEWVQRQIQSKSDP